MAFGGSSLLEREELLVAELKSGGLVEDRPLGFSRLEVIGFPRGSRFRDIQTSVVHRDAEAPYFETVLAAVDR